MRSLNILRPTTEGDRQMFLRHLFTRSRLVLPPILVVLCLFMPVMLLRSQQQDPAAPPPAWAYGFASPAASGENLQGARDPSAAFLVDYTEGLGDKAVRHLPGSDLGFIAGQIRDAYGPADWYPNDHPQMPDIVAHGRKPEVVSCALCHYANGKGDPANANISGLPYDYIRQTLDDFRNGVRNSSDRRKWNTNSMIGFAKAMNEDDIAAAAKYFSSIPTVSRIKIVETETAPKTRIVGAGVFLALDSGEKEPIGDRIIEVPDTTRAFILRDSRAVTISYVPVGSVEKGARLVLTGGNKTTQCAICHGADLEGLGPVPGISARFPSYIMRQLYDMKHGTRKGHWTDLMKPVVAQLTTDDMLAISAYLGSRSTPETQDGNSSKITLKP